MAISALENAGFALYRFGEQLGSTRGSFHPTQELSNELFHLHGSTAAAVRDLPAESQPSAHAGIRILQTAMQSMRDEGVQGVLPFRQRIDAALTQLAHADPTEWGAWRAPVT